MRLEAEWNDAWQALHLAPPEGVLESVLSLYAEPHRAYHTASHLEACFAELGRVAAPRERPGEVEIALFFHDAVYDPRAHDNEERSADLAASALQRVGASEPIVERVRALVMATKHSAQPLLRDARLLVDVDLSILGAEPAQFDVYEGEVRLEYAWVPPDPFRQGRAAILRQFLERPRIYSTESFFLRLESRARENLSRSLRLLSQ